MSGWSHYKRDSLVPNRERYHLRSVLVGEVATPLLDRIDRAQNPAGPDRATRARRTFAACESAQAGEVVH